MGCKKRAGPRYVRREVPVAPSGCSMDPTSPSHAVDVGVVSTVKLGADGKERALLVRRGAARWVCLLATVLVLCGGACAVRYGSRWSRGWGALQVLCVSLGVCVCVCVCPCVCVYGCRWSRGWGTLQVLCVSVCHCCVSHTSHTHAHTHIHTHTHTHTGTHPGVSNAGTAGPRIFRHTSAGQRGKRDEGNLWQRCAPSTLCISIY